MAALAWGKKVSPAFAHKVVSLAHRLSTTTAIVDPNWLMACMAFETGERFTANVKNPASSATGLIQFMRDTATGLGTTTAALARMSAVAQLDYVEKYFMPYRGRIHTLSDCYMVILFPKAVGKPESYRMFVQGDRNYFANKGLDVDHDGAVTKAEAAAHVMDKLRKGMKPGFIGGDDEAVVEEPAGPVLEQPDEDDTRQQEDDDPNSRWKPGVSYPEIKYIQQSLKALSYPPGIIDGKWGGATAGAIKAFKNDRHLTGPIVADDSLREELDKAGEEIGPDGKPWRRPVSELRKTGDDEVIAEVAPEVKPAGQSRFMAFITMITTAVTGLFTGITQYFGEAWESTESIRSSFGKVPGWVWFVSAAVVAGLWYWKSRQAHALIEKSFRTGERQ